MRAKIIWLQLFAFTLSHTELLKSLHKHFEQWKKKQSIHILWSKEMVMHEMKYLPVIMLANPELDRQNDDIRFDLIITFKFINLIKD
jgi:hypothetical protein